MNLCAGFEVGKRCREEGAYFRFIISVGWGRSNSVHTVNHILGKNDTFLATDRNFLKLK